MRTTRLRTTVSARAAPAGRGVAGARAAGGAWPPSTWASCWSRGDRDRSTEEKLAVCRQIGADHVINYTQGFREQVKDLTEGRGADVIYDPVGGDVFDESMRCIAPFGRILIVGFTSGRPAAAKTNHLLIKDAEAIGFTIGGLSKLDPLREHRNAAVLMGWLAAGRITPHISHRLPLAKAGEALALVRDRKVIGKAVLV